MSKDVPLTLKLKTGGVLFFSGPADIKFKDGFLFILGGSLHEQVSVKGVVPASDVEFLTNGSFHYPGIEALLPRAVTIE